MEIKIFSLIIEKQVKIFYSLLKVVKDFASHQLVVLLFNKVMVIIQQPLLVVQQMEEIM